MKTITTNFCSNRIYNIENIFSSDFNKKSVAYFDIETTGLSSSYNQIYLIGVAYQNDNGNFTITQWFDNTSNDEAKLLLKFREFLKKFDYLIEFNGNSFDIPFVENRGRQYGITFNFNKIIPIDIYREFKYYKSLFKLDNLKQKTIENFLGIVRDDLYNGGELIDIYKEYVKTDGKNENFFNILMLHNLEDMKGLIDICDIMTYKQLFDGDFSLKSITLENNYVLTECTLTTSVPVEIFITAKKISIKAHANTLKILIPITTATLKYFYDNYKDYFYLPYEDTAIHKSVAQFVDKDYRKKAKKETCYTKKKADFLIQYDEVISPAFKENFKDKISFFEINEDIINDFLYKSDKKILFKEYIKNIIIKTSAL